MLFLTMNAHAQSSPPVSQSPVVVAARTCMQSLIAAAKAANLETDTIGAGAVTILDPSRENLLPLASQASKCMSAALRYSGAEGQQAESESLVGEVQDQIVFCFTPSNPAGPDHVSKLGGHGPKRAWHTVLFRCGVAK